ncbi:MAG: translation initiation factor IF-2 [Nanoarchaeota archaeon]
MPALRSPIVSVLGHVDHGKSSILDAIRGSNIISKEAGSITQAIGASIVPLEVVKKLCGAMLSSLNMEFTIPGLLFIDTPGHAAFTSLRRRGGSLADIAVVVIDINEGFRPQTMEAIEILRAAKTPFVIAANKIDLLPGYRRADKQLARDIAGQTLQVQELLDTKIYQIVGTLHEKFGMQSERFDRADFIQQVAIIPCSAKQHVGMAELLMVLTGLAQKYLEDSLNVHVSGPAKGTVLEVKEEKGLGATLDVIIYDGTLRVNDTLVIGGVDGAITTKVRALLLPDPLAEMRDKKTKFRSVKEVQAATGVKVSAPDLKDVLAGMPLVSADDAHLEEAKHAVQEEIEDIIIITDDAGIILKADTLGSLEALINIFQEKKCKVRKATVGPIAKKDIAEAEANFERDPRTAVIIGFNIPPTESTASVKIITAEVIYTLVDRYEEWLQELKKKEESGELSKVVRPCKIEVLANCIFRQKNPCIVGVEILTGSLRTGTPIMKDGVALGIVKSIQSEGKSISEATVGKQVAISLPSVVAGKQIEERDILYAAVPEEDFRKLRGLKEHLDANEKETMRQIAEIYRRNNVVWGV